MNDNIFEHWRSEDFDNFRYWSKRFMELYPLWVPELTTTKVIKVFHRFLFWTWFTFEKIHVLVNPLPKVISPNL